MTIRLTTELGQNALSLLGCAGALAVYERLKMGFDQERCSVLLAQIIAKRAADGA